MVISSGSDSTFGSAIGGLAVGNRILSNSIFSNGETGIDLAGGLEDSFGVTANDTDAPSSNNHRQNFPEKTSATRSISTNLTTIRGTLNSNPNQDLHYPVLRGGA